MTGILYGLQWGLNSYAEAEPRPAEGAPVTLGVTVSRRNRRTTRPELALSAGPVTLGQPGGGAYSALYGSAWAVTLGKAGARLWQASGGVWRGRVDAEATAAIPAGARHVALAFDQAARPVLAWEVTGAVFVRQWEPGRAEYVTRGPWAGRDPVLICDAVLGGAVAVSDVLLLTLEGSALVARVQAERYAVAQVMADVGAGAVLDQVTPGGLTWQALGEGEGGAFAVRSDLYPAYVGDRAALAVGPLGGGGLHPVVIVRQGGPDSAAGAVGPLGGGFLTSPVITRTLTPDSAAGAVGPLGGGFLTSPVITRTLTPDSAAGAVGPLGGGQLRAVVIIHTLTQDSAAGAVGPLGGGNLTQGAS